MAPFIVLIALFGFFYALGRAWLPAQFDWLTSLRLALAGMFLLTASAHWGRRHDLIAMVPPAFPRPDLLVAVTGMLEIAGAVGLMLPKTAAYAALEHFQSYYKLALVGGKMGWRLSAFTDARAILQRFAT